MKSKLMAGLVFGAVLAFGQAPADVQLKAARHKEQVEGDLKGAIEAYRKIVANHGGNRTVAATALLYMAECHEKLGQSEARKLYEEITKSYGDQAGVATQARQRLTALDGAFKQPGGLAARQVWTGPEVDPSGSISPDGRFMAMVQPGGDLGLRDMTTGQVRTLNGRVPDSRGGFADAPVFSPDQRQIAYAWWSPEEERWHLRVVAHEPGSKPRILVNNPEIFSPDPAGWSLDGKSILVTVWRKDRTAQLAWISAADGSVKMLRSLEWRQPGRVALSPDGRYVAYDVLQRQDSTDRDIYVLAADGSSEHSLVQAPLHDAEPCWTPDGSRIVFLSNRSGRMDLWSIAVRDGKPQSAAQVVKTDIGTIRPKGFTRAGSFYYVHVFRDDDVFTAELDRTTGKTRGPAARVTQANVGHNERPAWSPDGKWIAFHSLRGHARNGPGAVSLTLHSMETGAEQVFALNLATVERPVWFHDGSALLQAAWDQRGQVSFHRVRTGTGKFELLRESGVEFKPGIALASDDTTLYAPTFDEARKVGGVTRFDLSTGQQTRLYTVPNSGFVPGLSLSPDGHTLAILQFNLEGSRMHPQVAAISVDGGAFRPLVNAAEGSGFMPVQGLAWSADGRHVYFVRTKKGEDSQLWRVPAAGGAAEYAGISAKGLRGIDVSADGSRLAFTAGERGNAELWVLENLIPALKAAR
jgi:Tol biopolymer transport system component